MKSIVMSDGVAYTEEYTDILESENRRLRKALRFAKADLAAAIDFIDIALEVDGAQTTPSTPHD